MLKKLFDFFKRIFGKEQILEIETPKIEEKNQTRKPLFDESLKNTTDNRMRLLELQNQFKTGNIKEEDMNDEDIIELKKLYCEQILELANSIEAYTTKMKV